MSDITFTGMNRLADVSGQYNQSTQEAGGFSYGRLLGDLRMICRELNVVALDNVELSPALDPTGRSTALACKLLREELLAL